VAVLPIPLLRARGARYSRRESGCGRVRLKHGACVSSGPNANICSMSELGDQVRLFHRQGLKSLEIAHRLNIAQSTVQYHLRQLREPDESASPSGPAGRPKASRIKTREVVAQLLARGLSRAEVARRLGLAKSTVTYHASRLGGTVDQRFARRFDWPLIQAYYDEGHSLRECMRTFGFGNSSWQLAVRRGEVVPRPRFRPIDEVFAANTHRNRGGLKSRLLSQGLKENRCEQCGIAEWQGRPLSVALHHVNGDRLDNRLENLELLCPNCHSQTENFGGRGENRHLLRPPDQRGP
jgi:DNA-binding CsgD family transcriptional regulator